MSNDKQDEAVDSKSTNKTKADSKTPIQKEYGGRDGPEPTRYGDWEKKGIISDFLNSYPYLKIALSLRVAKLSLDTLTDPDVLMSSVRRAVRMRRV